MRCVGYREEGRERLSREDRGDRVDHDEHEQRCHGSSGIKKRLLHADQYALPHLGRAWNALGLRSVDRWLI